MVLYVECWICGVKIEYTPDTVAALGNHLFRKHPTAKADYFSINSFKDSDLDNGAGDGVTNLDTDGKESEETVKTQAGKGKKKRKDFMGKGRYRRKMYKTTVETWKPGKGDFKCSYCGHVGTPHMRRKQNLVARTPIGALCMLSCWPFCFLPFMMCKGRYMNAHCSKCGIFLGTYDTKKGTLTPCTGTVERSCLVEQNDGTYARDGTYVKDGVVYSASKNAPLTEPYSCICESVGERKAANKGK